MSQTDVSAVNISYQRVVFYASLFLIPAIFTAPQIVTGTMVNALLFMAAQKLTHKELYPALVLPSLGAVTHGVLFGPQTVFLYYFLPFIWISNYLMVSIFLATKQQGFPLRVLLSAFGKYVLLILAAQVYFRAGIVPLIFVTSMGVIQLITALFGGCIAYGYLYYLQRHERSKYSH